jgi:hypothetical protein
MDLGIEIKALLTRASETHEYFNPHFVVPILDAMVDCGYSTEEELDGLYEWAQGLWSM